MCGKSGGDCGLHVGHIISVKAGVDSGLTDAQINDPENLMCMCDECNLGMGQETVPLRFAVRLFWARKKIQGDTNDSN
jgi:hypothetical protein